MVFFPGLPRPSAPHEQPNWPTHSRLLPIIDAARTIKRHWGRILRWFTSKIKSDLLEEINSRIQTGETIVRGYRSSKNFSTMICLIAGKLKFDLPM
ncbi:transposase [Desulfosarcina sp. OttesenSCG-928-B08]|nr:transposase [Desulfosarcina sp. OttesenSCG-928-B08]